MSDRNREGAAASAAPSDTEIAWAAGLFEGEGSVSMHQQRGARVYARLGLGITDRDVLEHFVRVVGAGSVCSWLCNDGRDGKKQRFDWQISALDDVTRITGMLYPYLGNRRQTKIVDCLAADTRLA